jgi:uncharacterized membrane protein
MACDPQILQHVPLFALLDEEELAVLASQVELKTFSARQRIYKIGEAGGRAYVLVSGAVQVTTVDQDHQEVLVDRPALGDFFGFASMLDGTAHQTTAIATEESTAVEVDRRDITVLLQRKPLAGVDMLTVLGRQFHASQELVRLRATRNANEVIEEQATFGERLADAVAHFGGSWSFIVAFGFVLSVYVAVNSILRGNAWDPYPYILLNLFLSMLASVQAPVIMMSQNRQDTKDRLRGELDYEVNRRAEAEIQGLSRKLNLVDEKVDDLADLLRKKA